MMDWTQITGFEWDAGNERKNVEKHGVSHSGAEQVFFNQPLLVLEDGKHSQMEPRLHALGVTAGHCLLHVTFTLRADDTLIRIISARDMHRKERIVYEQSKGNA